MRVFAFIEAEKANFSIKFMCERLGVTRGGFYAWRKRPPSRRRVTDAAYTAVIKKIHADSRGNYGAPRICAELADDYNIRCGRKRVARLMRQAGIAGCHRRKRTWTTRRDDSQPPAPDRVNRQFAAAGPNELWVADIERHEAFLNPAMVRGHRLRLVAASWLKLRAAGPGGHRGGWKQP